MPISASVVPVQVHQAGSLGVSTPLLSLWDLFSVLVQDSEFSLKFYPRSSRNSLFLNTRQANPETVSTAFSFCMPPSQNHTILELLKKTWTA